MVSCAAITNDAAGSSFATDIGPPVSIDANRDEASYRRLVGGASQQAPPPIGPSLARHPCVLG
jgi:hypothetical protein